MPELPEVETVCRALKPALEGQSLLKIQLNRPDLRFPLPLDLEKQLIGHVISGVSRRAKYLLVSFSHGLTLIWHLGMSGRVIIETPHAPFLEEGRHDHVIFTTSGHHKITYRDPRRFGFILLTPTHLLDTLTPFNQLGPEPFHDINLTGLTFHARLQNRAIPLKNALLDQRILAGLGNIYASEALWQARLSPLRPCNTLSLREAGILLTEIREVLTRAIALGGSTLRDHIRPDGEKGYFQHYFKVYDCKDKLCSQCQVTPICKIMQSGRATYYCTQCQR